MSESLSFANETFVNFAFYSGVVIAKTMLMGPLTSVVRLRKKVFSNSEDCKFFAPPGTPINMNDSLVERIRRCHQNDLENVVPFTLIGLLYVSGDPYPDVALNLFRVFAASRILHTLAYVGQAPQPARAVCYFVGWGCTALMGMYVFFRCTM